MKRLISFMTVVIMLVMTAVNVSAADVAEYEFGEIANLSIGDVDADTEITSTDLAVMRKFLVKADEAVSGFADMNYDSAVNLIDLVRLKKKISGAELASIFEPQANALKEKILESTDVVSSSFTGNVYHISAYGSFMADGSAEKPYSYALLTSNGITLKSGDAVLFKRGDVFRGKLVVETANVYYGAFGSGDKPVINGSAMNYSGSAWNDEGNNIYSLSGFSSDVGFVMFSSEDNIGYKRESLSELKADFDFWFDSEELKLYIYSSKLPSSYGSIEIGEKNDIIRIKASNVTVDNLCVKYTGGHGISTANGCANITVKNCEIAYLGGSYLSENLRYGNGIEFWCESNNMVVDNNWIHDIYDSGVTHQGGGEYIVRNVTVNANLIERCGMGSVEYWLGFSDSDGDGVYDGESKGYDINYTNNIMRYAGYGFGGEQRPDKVSSHIRSDVACPNWIEGFTVRNNIFDISSGDLLEIGGTYATYPTLEGNTYAQLPTGSLGVYGDTDADDFGIFIKDTINYGFGDTKAKVCYY